MVIGDRFMSNSKMQAAFCLLVCMVVHASFATVTYTNWYPNPAKNTGAKTDGIAALRDLSYWMANGQVGSGTVGPCDRLIIDRARDGNNPQRLRFSFNDEFKGDKLQIGSESVGITVVHDSGMIKFAEESEGLVLWSGNWWFNDTNKTFEIAGPVTVLAEDPEKPFVFHVGQRHYLYSTGKITGSLDGSEDACILFGPWGGKNVGEGKAIVCAKNSTFELHDISGYAGTITIDSDYENVGTDFGTRVKFDSAESSAKIHVCSGGSISTLAFDDKVTVGSLTFDAGTRIYIDQGKEDIDGSLGHFHATESLSINGKVEICYKPIIRGARLYRIPILSGPATSTFTVDDFEVTFIAEKYNLDLHLEVASDPETGVRTLYVVTHGFIYQTDIYRNEGERDGGDGTPSSLTNSAAWWGGYIPHETNSAAIYRTARSLRTLFTPQEDYVFPCAIFYLNGGTLIVQTKSFQVPELYISSGMIGTGQDYVSASRTIRVSASKIHFMNAGSSTDLRTYSSDTLILEGEVDGPGDINLVGWGRTGSPKCNYMLDGLNTNYTGSIALSTAEVRAEYHDLITKFPTLYVKDGRNLGGRKDEFDPRALTLKTLGRLSVNDSSKVVLAKGLNRGVYIYGCGRFHVTGNDVLDVQWPILISGRMRKEGDGTLVLGGGMKHELDDGGELSDIPRAGSNIFEVVKGKVKVAHADALSGLETSFAAGTSVELVFDSANADLVKYGIRNVTVDAPFSLDASFGGKLPFSVDASSALPPEPGTVVTNGLITVKNSAAESVRSMLQVKRPWKNISSKLIELGDAETGTTTFALESRFVGTVISVR